MRLDQGDTHELPMSKNAYAHWYRQRQGFNGSYTAGGVHLPANVTFRHRAFPAEVTHIAAGIAWSCLEAEPVEGPSPSVWLVSLRPRDPATGQPHWVRISGGILMALGQNVD